VINLRYRRGSSPRFEVACGPGATNLLFTHAPTDDDRRTEPTTEFLPRDRDTEPSPSAGWRETCADLHVKPGRPAPADPTTRDAVDDPRRPRRNRVKHALGVST
jgi:hypothetical protein